MIILDPFFLLHVVSMIFANDLPVGKWFGIDYLLDLLYIGKHQCGPNPKSKTSSLGRFPEGDFWRQQCEMKSRSNLAGNQTVKLHANYRTFFVYPRHVVLVAPIQTSLSCSIVICLIDKDFWERARELFCTSVSLTHPTFKLDPIGLVPMPGSAFASWREATFHSWMQMQIQERLGLLLG